ncbi:MAG TPA: poly(R)-hydroxyalkanoic acid synthase subunit PhaE [Candidatus Thermoplasmatota archaeon]|nr:poly(R)-hydroxyalkanoic acid synthase subunit PhaE [Candidatus Thermoplasmatota archaeon]
MPETPTTSVEPFARAAEQAVAFNLQVGRAFMDAWARSLADLQKTSADTQRAFRVPVDSPRAALAGAPFADVGRIWLETMNEATRRTQEAMQKGQLVTPDAYVDLWSKAASELAQAVVSDASFAALTGEWVNAVSQARGEARRTGANQLREMGFATHTDVEEVGKRLIELERRVHDLALLVEDEIVPSKATAPAKARGGRSRERADDRDKAGSK